MKAYVHKKTYIYMILRDFIQNNQDLENDPNVDQQVKEKKQTVVNPYNST